MVIVVATILIVTTLLCVGAYLMMNTSSPSETNTNQSKGKADEMVCMTKTTYDRLSQSPKVVYKEKIVHTPIVHAATDVVDHRDRKVLHDELYPAVNRTSAHLFRDFHLHKDIFNIPTQPGSDTYRLVGYLKNDSDPNGTWKLFGRDKDRNQGEYYMIPTNHINDIKIQVTDSIISGRDRLRSLDTIPDTISFNSPLLAKTPYTFVELPKGDLKDLRYL